MASILPRPTQSVVNRVLYNPDAEPKVVSPASDEGKLSPVDWYDLVVEASADGSWFYDIENGQIHYSPRFLDILDFEAGNEELAPKKFFERVHPADRIRCKRDLIGHLKGEVELFQTEIRVLDGSDNVRWILNRGIARRDKSGRAYCMLGSIMDITRRKHLEESLRAVALSARLDASTEFFHSLVRYLGEALASDYVLIGRLDASQSCVNTIAVYRDGQPAPNFQYALTDTPCRNVVGKRLCVYPERAAQLFPGDPMLQDESIEGYIGIPLFDSGGGAMGLMVALYRRPLMDVSTAEDLLKIFGSRAASELERADKEEALARSERRYRELYHRTPVMLQSIDRQGRLVAVSDYWLQCLGYTEAEVLGRPLTDFLTETSRRRAREEILPALFRTGNCANVPYQVVKADGTIIDVLLSAVAEYDDQSNVERSLAVMTDVTDQRRAEAEYRDIFNHATEGIYRTSPEGKLLRANPALVQLHGYESEEVLLESISDIATQWYVDPTDRERILHRLNSEGRADNFEVQIYRHATGERIWVNENSRAVYDVDGEIVYYEGTVHDISDRRRLEAAYRDIFDNVGEGIYRSTPAGELVHVNPALARLQGFDTPEELLKAVKDLNTDWYLEPGARAELQRVLNQHGYVDSFEAQVRCLNRNEPLWTSETVRVTRDQDGNVQYYEGLVRDITAEHKARQLASRRNTVLEMIARDAPMSEILHDIVDITQGLRENLAAAVFRLRDGKLYTMAAPRLQGGCLAAIDGSTPTDVGGAVYEALHGDGQVARLCLTEWTGPDDALIVAMRAAGYHGVLAVPMRDQQGAVLGLLTAFVTTERHPDHTASIELLREMAQITSIAIEQHRLTAALLRQAQYDPLTELPNRMLLTDRLERAIAEARRNGYSIGVLLLDLDEFKLVNDSLGHRAGDHLLRQVAMRLTKCSRDEDTVARLGGDEFVMVVPLKHNEHYCGDVAERIRHVLQDHFHVLGREVSARPSIGISLFPQDGETTEALLQAADMAMYAAKHAGKNQCRYFAETMNRQVSERLQIESELRDAFRKGQLELFYQPRISLDTGMLCGAEALLRWHHPDRGLLTAGAFIHIAERGPLISEIDNIVLQEAAETLAAWQHAGRNLVLAVNLSARELHADGFATQVARILQAADVDPSGLELEITENILIQDYERTRRQLINLKERAPGLRIAIDDFGSGYSSLNYLRQLPIDTLKIDRTFVADLAGEAGETAGAIAKTIVELGRNLGLTVVAEGVETPAQAACLSSYHCHQAHGFLYGAALPLDEFDRRLVAETPNN